MRLPRADVSQKICMVRFLHPNINMIIPLTAEQAWLDHLKALPPWLPSPDPLLIVVPHPDDETLGAGGLLALQCQHAGDLTVLAVTDGENAYEDTPDLGLVREQEQVAALLCLGLQDQKQIVRLRLPDSSVHLHEEELEERIAALASKRTVLVAPWIGDFHPDHEACGRAAERVASRYGLRLLFYFFWTWHRGTPRTLEGLSLVRLELPEQVVARKQKALLCHTSQLEREGGDAILPPDLRAPSSRPFEVFLSLFPSTPRTL